jgi:hypothetical protein
VLEGIELEGHSFEILKLTKEGENWLAQFAVDGVPYPPFYEPHANVVDMDGDSFLVHMKSQALTVVSAVQQGMMA